MIYTSHFDIEEELSSNNAAIAVGDLDFNSRLTQKEFDSGFLEGGGLASNSYLTSNIGLGVQRTLTNGISLYLQPSYNYHTMGATVGPNNDRIHSLSLQIGAKVALN